MAGIPWYIQGVDIGFGPIIIGGGGGMAIPLPYPFCSMLPAYPGHGVGGFHTGAGGSSHWPGGLSGEFQFLCFFWDLVLALCLGLFGLVEDEMVHEVLCFQLF